MEIHPVLTVNQRLEIMLAKGPQAERYPSKVEEATESYLLLAMPMSKGVPVLPQSDTVFYGRMVMGGAVWLFASRFLDKRLRPVLMWVCSPAYDFRKIQQRAFVRLETALPVILRPAVDGGDAQPVSATTRDIGGGGLQLVTRELIPQGVVVKVEFDLGEFKIFTGSAVVVRAEYDNFRKICCLGLKFVDLSERERDKIIKYIFKRQLERRQKGVGL